MADSSQRFAATSSFDKTDLVTLLVGPNEHEIAVHEDFITRSSEFFKAAMKKEWVEGQTRVIRLPEESCLETLRCYLSFVYEQKLPTQSLAVGSEGFVNKPWGTLARLYILGERLLDTEIQHAVIKEMLRLCYLKDNKGSRWFPARETVTKIYDGTPAGSPARRLMVDLHVSHANGNWLKFDDHPEFLADLSKALIEKVSIPEASRSFDFRTRILFARDYFA